jgi:hypothetical protein
VATTMKKKILSSTSTTETLSKILFRFDACFRACLVFSTSENFS